MTFCCSVSGRHAGLTVFSVQVKHVCSDGVPSKGCKPLAVHTIGGEGEGEVQGKRRRSAGRSERNNRGIIT